MKKLKLFSIFAVMAFCLAGLTACGGGFDPAALLKGNLDVIYLGQCDDSHLKSVGLTKEEAQEYYEDGILVEADYFASYFDCEYDNLSEATQQRIVDMYKQIYTHSKYEIGDVSKNGETYLVALTISPIDFISKFVNEDYEAFYADMESRYNSGEFEAMSDEEFDEAWIIAILDTLEPRLDSIGYLEPETISVQIAKDTDGYYTITDKDFSRIDNMIFLYE